MFYYYHGDHLGSSNILTDRNGNIVQQYEHTAYGVERVKTSSAAFAVTHRYTSQHLDEATGLYYYQSRYYDPEVGRFIQADTIVPSASDPQMLNRYTYARNNPYLYVDPTGHVIDWAAIGIALLIATAVGAGVGAAVAAATGGDVGMGAATGAISGLLTAAGGVFGGAAAGAINAELTGGDPGMGALIGAISTAISFAVGYYADTRVLQGIDNAWVRDAAGYGISSASGGITGGVAAEISGGDFWSGFAQGAATGAAAHLAGSIAGMMVESLSEPEYDPGRWNDDPKVCQENNCGNYAYDRQTGDFLQPGDVGAQGFTQWSRQDFHRAARADGLTPASPLRPFRSGHHRVQLYYGDITDGAGHNIGRDFHWYRKDAGGYWSHKPGGGLARNVDGAGALIRNPRFANRTMVFGPPSAPAARLNYHTFVGEYWVPNSLHR